MYCIVLAAISLLAGLQLERFLVKRALRHRGFDPRIVSKAFAKQDSDLGPQVVLACPRCGSADVCEFGIGDAATGQTLTHLFCCYCRRTSRRTA